MAETPIFKRLASKLYKENLPKHSTCVQIDKTCVPGCKKSLVGKTLHCLHSLEFYPDKLSSFAFFFFRFLRLSLSQWVWSLIEFIRFSCFGCSTIPWQCCFFMLLFSSSYPVDGHWDAACSGMCQSTMAVDVNPPPHTPIFFSFFFGGGGEISF